MIRYWQHHCTIETRVRDQVSISDDEMIGPPMPPQQHTNAAEDDDGIMGPPLPPGMKNSKTSTSKGDKSDSDEDDEEDEVKYVVRT